MKTSFLVKLAGFILIIGLVLFLNDRFLNIEPERLQIFLLSFGVLAPFIFILIYMIRPFFLFPSSILAVAGGLSFGPIIGPVATYIGSLSGAILSFIVIRKLGKRFIKKSFGDRYEVIQTRIEENGFSYILALRIVPVINFDLVSYLSALSRVNMKTYIGATMIGILPGTLAFNLLGASIADLSWQMIVLTISMFVVSFFIPVAVRKALKNRNIDLPDKEALK
ncbi:TVP38/TMEM64 family protein [Paenalkalicoccus suaedae]|uniref:TVP38/TMEM64 family membrane protein n=1 Tax=Paenalkalicoccus suaedae TaxID=2592382 RepID=A0A859FEB4_9BACI|nr:TVP38/TMEM64 family protein [Paenalkalicoccus suaedae]QKS71188.1 TVP38/TMEM64 family protein [Paenalkalicoccus suaedae]